MATQSRVYILIVGDKKRLVRATHPATARSHVASDTIKVAVASQDDLIDCLSKGVRVEDAAAVQAEQQVLPE